MQSFARIFAGKSQLLVAGESMVQSAQPAIVNLLSLQVRGVADLTSSQVKDLQSIASAVKSDSHKHGSQIFKKAFQRDGSSQKAFPKFASDDVNSLDKNPAFQKQVDAFMKNFVFLLENSGNSPDLKARLHDLHKSHKHLHLPSKHYSTFGHAVEDHLKDSLGSKYSKDANHALAKFWKYVSARML